MPKCDHSKHLVYFSGTTDPEQMLDKMVAERKEPAVKSTPLHQVLMLLVSSGCGIPSEKLPAELRRGHNIGGRTTRFTRGATNWVELGRAMVRQIRALILAIKTREHER
jgi:hypothetical protein